VRKDGKEEGEEGRISSSTPILPVNALAGIEKFLFLFYF
jgi:hypothetical protein